MKTIWVLLVEYRKTHKKEIMVEVAGAYNNRPHAGLIIGAIREYAGVDLTRTYRDQPKYIGDSLENDTVFKVGQYKFTLQQVEVEK